MSNIYISGRVGVSQDDISKLAYQLEERGHQIVMKWWENSPIKPYLSNVNSNAPLARVMLEASEKCEVFILIGADDILGAAIEYGAALASLEQMPEKKIVAIIPDSIRQSILYTHPGVKLLNDVSELEREVWY